MSISTWPKLERPREKLLALGASTLSDAELLAIIFHTGTRGKTALDLARETLNQHGGLRRLLQVDQITFMRTRGLGENKYAQLQALLEINRRHALELLENTDVLRNSHITRQFLRSKLHGYPNEVFVSLFLNCKNQIIQYEELFQGTLTQTNIYPRELIKRALHHNAANVVIAHNHPSGDPQPSKEDIAITKQLQSILEYIDVRLLDHLIVGKNEVVSLAELGKM
jgi:DNA repair protein RadC